MVDVAQQTAQRLVATDFWFDRTLLVAPDRRTLYVLGFALADVGATILDGDPFLVAVDTTTGTLTVRLPLPGVRLDQRHEMGTNGPFYAYYLPALALSPDGNQLYLAHAEADQLTVIDLRQFRIQRTVTIAQTHAAGPAGLLVALLDRLAGRAEAKGAFYATRQLLVSRDGQRLYVTGIDFGHGAVPREEPLPAGLTVLNAQTLQVLHQEPDIDKAVLSPDGRWLYGSAWSQDDLRTRTGPAATPTSPHPRGLRFFDTQQLRVVRELAPAQTYQQLALSPDGRELYLVTRGPGLGAEGSNLGRCTQPCWGLEILDTVTGQQLAAQRLDAVTPWLVTPNHVP